MIATVTSERTHWAESWQKPGLDLDPGLCQPLSIKTSFFPFLFQSPCPPIKYKHNTQSLSHQIHERGEPLYATHADNDVKDKFNFCFQRNLKKSLDKFFSKQNQLLLWIVTAVGVEKQLCYPTASRFPFNIL